MLQLRTRYPPRAHRRREQREQRVGSMYGRHERNKALARLENNEKKKKSTAAWNVKAYDVPLRFVSVAECTLRLYCHTGLVGQKM